MTEKRLIQHITLRTGRTRQVLRSEVSDADASTCDAWIVRAIHSATPLSLPAPHALYAGKALRVQGGLVVTVFDKEPDIGRRLPLLMFTVGMQSPHVHALWSAVLQDTDGTAEGILRPPAPWCAMSQLHSPGDLEVLERLADFAGACAWAWVIRNPVLRSVS